MLIIKWLKCAKTAKYIAVLNYNYSSNIYRKTHNSNKMYENLIISFMYFKRINCVFYYNDFRCYIVKYVVFLTFSTSFIYALK